MVYPREKKLWSYSEESILIRFFRDQITIIELANRHARSPIQIIHKLTELGWLESFGQSAPDLDALEHWYLVDSEPANHDIYEEYVEDDSEDYVYNPEDYGEDYSYHDNGQGFHTGLVPDFSVNHSVQLYPIYESDWGETGDDLESNDWEIFLGGPDDGHWEHAF